VSQGSVTRWIDELKAGDEQAAQKIWERYYERLVRICRIKLAQHSRRAADEEDVALNAFNSLYRAIQAGRYPQLADRTDLWRLLVTIAARKALSQIESDRRQKRGQARVRGESAFDSPSPTSGARGIEQVVGDAPSPDLASLIAEQYESLLAVLDNENLRLMARKKLEGWTNEEIAAQLGCSLRTVERRLQMVRSAWSQQLAADSQ
jgi:RNA polymerase sigma factor (sigma-70 family)